MSETVLSQSSTPKNGDETSPSYSYSYTESLVADDLRHAHAFRVVVVRLEADGTGSDFHHELSGPVASRPNVRCAFYLSTHHTPSPTSSSMSTLTSDELEADTESTAPVTAGLSAQTHKTNANVSPARTAAAGLASSASTASGDDVDAGAGGSGTATIQRPLSDLSSNNTDEELTEEVYRPHYPWRVESSAKTGDDNSETAYTVTGVDIQVSETEDATLIATLQMGTDLHWSFTLTSPADGVSNKNVWLVCEIIDEVMAGCALKCAIPLPEYYVPRRSVPTPTREGKDPAAATSETRRALFNGNPETDATDADDPPSYQHNPHDRKVEKIPFVMMHDTGARSRRAQWFLRCYVEPVLSTASNPTPTRRSQTAVTHSRPVPAPQREDSLHASALSEPAPAQLSSPKSSLAYAVPTDPLPSPAAATTAPMETAPQDTDEGSLHNIDEAPAAASTVAAPSLDDDEPDDDQPSSVVSSTSTIISPSRRTLGTATALSEAGNIDARSPFGSLMHTANVRAQAVKAAGRRPRDKDPRSTNGDALHSKDSGSHDSDADSRHTPEQAFVESEEDDGDRDDDEADVVMASAPGAGVTRLSADVDDDRAAAVSRSIETAEKNAAFPSRAGDEDTTTAAHDIVGSSASLVSISQHLARDASEGIETSATWETVGESAAHPPSEKAAMLSEGVSPLPRNPGYSSSASSRAFSSNAPPSTSTPAPEAHTTPSVLVAVTVPTSGATGPSSAVNAATSGSPQRLTSTPKSSKPPLMTTYLPDEAIRIPALVSVDGTQPQQALLLPRLSTDASIPAHHVTTTPTNTTNATHQVTAAVVTGGLDLFERSSSSISSSSSTTSSILSTTTSTVSRSHRDALADGAQHRRTTSPSRRRSNQAQSTAAERDGDAWRWSSSRSQPFASSPTSRSWVRDSDDTDVGYESDSGEEAEPDRADHPQRLDRRQTSRTQPSQSNTDAGEGDENKDRDGNHHTTTTTTVKRHGPPHHRRSHRQRRPTMDEVLASHRADDVIPFEATQPRPPPPPMPLSSEEAVTAQSSRAAIKRVAASSSVQLLSSSEFRDRRPSESLCSGDKPSTAPDSAPAMRTTSSAKQDTARASEGKSPATQSSAQPSAGASQPPQHRPPTTANSTASAAAPPLSEDPLGQAVSVSSDRSALRPTSTPAHVVDVVAGGSARPRSANSGAGSESDGQGSGSAKDVRVATAEENRSVVTRTAHQLLSAQQVLTSANQYTSSAPVSPMSVNSHRRPTTADDDFLTYNTDHIVHAMPLMHFPRFPVEVQPARRSVDADGGSPRPPRSLHTIRTNDRGADVIAGAAPQLSAQSGSGSRSASHSAASSSYSYQYSYSYSDDDYYPYSASSHEAEHVSGDDSHRSDKKENKTHTDGNNQAARGGGAGGSHAATRRSRGHLRRRARSSGGNTALPQSISQVSSPPPYVVTSHPPTPLTTELTDPRPLTPPAEATPPLSASRSGEKDGTQKEGTSHTTPSKDKPKKKTRGILCCRRPAAPTPVAPLQVLYQCVTEHAKNTHPTERRAGNGEAEGETHTGTPEGPSGAVAGLPTLHAEHIYLRRLPSLTAAPDKRRRGGARTDEDAAVAAFPLSTPHAMPVRATTPTSSAAAAQSALSSPNATRRTLSDSLADEAGASTMANGQTARLIAENMQRLIHKLNRAGPSRRQSIPSSDSALLRSALDDMPAVLSAASANGVAAADTSAAEQDAPKAKSHGDACADIDSGTTYDAAAQGLQPRSSATADQRAFVPVASTPLTAGADAFTHQALDGTSASSMSPTAEAVRRVDDEHMTDDGQNAPGAVPRLSAVASDFVQGEDQRAFFPSAPGAASLPPLLGRASATADPVTDSHTAGDAMLSPSHDDAPSGQLTRAGAAASGGELPLPETTGKSDDPLTPDTRQPPAPDLPRLTAYMEVEPIPPLWAAEEMAALPVLHASVVMPALPYLYASAVMPALPYYYASDFMAALPYLYAWDAQPPWQKPPPDAPLRALVPASTQRFFFFVRLAGLARVARVLNRGDDCGGGARTPLAAGAQVRVSLLARRRTTSLTPAFAGTAPTWRVANGSIFTLSCSPAAGRNVATGVLDARNGWSDVLIFTDAAVRAGEGMSPLDSAAASEMLATPDDELDIFVQLERCVVRHITRTHQSAIQPVRQQAAPVADRKDAPRAVEEMPAVVAQPASPAKTTPTDELGQTEAVNDSTAPTAQPTAAQHVSSLETLAVSLSDRDTAATTAASSIVFRSEPSVQAAASASPPSTLGVSVSSSSRASSADGPAPPHVAATRIRQREGMRERKSVVKKSEQATTHQADVTETQIEAEAPAAAAPPPVHDSADSQPIDWSHYEVTWEPLAVSPAVCLRALQEATAAFAMQAGVSVPKPHARSYRDHNLYTSASSASALQSAFPLPLRATSALCVTNAGDARLAPSDTTEAVVEGEDVVLSTVSVSHSTGYYQPQRHDEAEKDKDDGDGGVRSTDMAALRKASRSLSALAHAIAECQVHASAQSAVALSSTETTTTTHGDHLPDQHVGFETIASTAFGPTSRPLTVLWETMPETVAEDEPRDTNMSACARNASVSPSLSASCCSVVLRCGVVVLEQVASLAAGAPLPLAALSVSTAHEGALATARPRTTARGLLDANTDDSETAMSSPLPAYLQQAPVMRYDVAVQTVLTVTTNPCLLLTVHSAFAKETVFGTATFSPFTAPATRSHLAWTTTGAGRADMWLPLYAPASAVTQHASLSRASGDAPGASVMDGDEKRANEGLLRVGWAHCDVECAFLTNGRSNAHRGATTNTGEDDVEITKCLWRYTDALQASARSASSFPFPSMPLTCVAAPSSVASNAELVDLVLIAATSLQAPTDGVSASPRSCSTFCEVEVLRKKTRASATRREEEEEGQNHTLNDSRLTDDAARTVSTMVSTPAMGNQGAEVTHQSRTSRAVERFPVTTTVVHSCEPVWQHTFRLRIDAAAGVRAAVVRVFDCAEASDPTAETAVPRLIGTVTLSTHLIRALCASSAADRGCSGDVETVSSAAHSTGPAWLPILPILSRKATTTMPAPCHSTSASGAATAVPSLVGALLIAASWLSPWVRPAAPTAPLARIGCAPHAFSLLCAHASEARLLRRHRRCTRPSGVTVGAEWESEGRCVCRSREQQEDTEDHMEMADAPLSVPGRLDGHTAWCFTYRHVCLNWPWLAHVLQLHGGLAYLLVEPLERESHVFSTPSAMAHDLFITPKSVPLSAQLFILMAVHRDEDRLRLLYGTHPTAQWRRRARRHEQRRQRQLSNTHAAGAESTLSHASACTTVFTITPCGVSPSLVSQTDMPSPSPWPLISVFSGAATNGLRYRVLHSQPGRPMSDSAVIGEGTWRLTRDAAMGLMASDTQPARGGDDLDTCRGEETIVRPTPARVNVLVAPLTAQWTAPMLPATSPSSSGAAPAGGEQVLMPWTPASAHDGRAMIYPQHVAPGLLSFQLDAFPCLPTADWTRTVTATTTTGTTGADEGARDQDDTSGAEKRGGAALVLDTSPRAVRSQIPQRWRWPDVGQTAFIELRVEDWVRLPTDATGLTQDTPIAMSDTCIWYTLGLSVYETECAACVCGQLATSTRIATAWTSRAATEKGQPLGPQQRADGAAETGYGEEDDGRNENSVSEVLRLEWPARQFPWFSRAPPILDLVWQTRANEMTTAPAVASATAHVQSTEIVGVSRVAFLDAFNAQSGHLWLPMYTTSAVTLTAALDDAAHASPGPRHVGYVRLRYEHNFMRRGDSTALPNSSTVTERTGSTSPSQPLTDPAPAVVAVSIKEVRTRPSKKQSCCTPADLQRTGVVPVIIGYNTYSYALSCPVSHGRTHGVDAMPLDEDAGASPSVVVFPRSSPAPPSPAPLTSLDPNRPTTSSGIGARVVAETRQEPNVTEGQLRVQVILTETSSGVRTVGYALMTLPEKTGDDVWLPLLSETEEPTEEKTDAARGRRRWLGEVRVGWRTADAPPPDAWGTPSASLYAALPLPHFGRMRARVLNRRACVDSSDGDDDDACGVPTRPLAALSDARVACHYVVLKDIQWAPTHEGAVPLTSSSSSSSSPFLLRVRGAGTGAHTEHKGTRHTVANIATGLSHALCPLDPTVDATVLRWTASRARTTDTVGRPVFTAATAAPTRRDELLSEPAQGTAVPIDSLVVPVVHASVGDDDDDVRKNSSNLVPLDIEVLQASASCADTTSATWTSVARGSVLVHHTAVHSALVTAERYAVPLYASSRPSGSASPPLVGQLSFVAATTNTRGLAWLPDAQGADEPAEAIAKDACEEGETPQRLPRPAMALFHLALTDIHWHRAFDRFVCSASSDDGPEISAVRLFSRLTAEETTCAKPVAVMVPVPASTGAVQWCAAVCVRPVSDTADTLRVELALITNTVTAATTCATSLSLHAPWTIGIRLATEEMLLYHATTQMCVGTACCTWRLLATSDDLYNPRSLFFTRRALLSVVSCRGLVHGDVESLREAACYYQRLRRLAESRHRDGRRLSHKHREQLDAARDVLDGLVVRASMDAIQCARADGAIEAEAVAAAMAERGFTLDLTSPSADVRLTEVQTSAFRAPTALHVLSHCPSLEEPIRASHVPAVIPLPPLDAALRHITGRALLSAAVECPFEADADADSAASQTLIVCLRRTSPGTENNAILGRGEWILGAPPCTDPRPTSEHQLVRLPLLPSPDKGLTLMTAVKWEAVVQLGDSYLRCLRVRVPAHVLRLEKQEAVTATTAAQTETPPTALRMRLTYGFHVTSAETYLVDVPLTVCARVAANTDHADATLCDWTASSAASRVPRVGDFGARLRAVELFVDTPGQWIYQDKRSSYRSAREGVSLGRHAWTPADEALLFGSASSSSSIPQAAVHWVHCTPSGTQEIGAGSALSCDLLLSREPITAATGTLDAPPSPSQAKPLASSSSSSRSLHVQEAELNMTGDVGATNACACQLTLVSGTLPSSSSASSATAMWRCVQSSTPAAALSRTLAAQISDRLADGKPENNEAADRLPEDDESKADGSQGTEELADHSDASATSEDQADVDVSDRASDDDDEASNDGDAQAAVLSSASSDFSAFDARSGRDDDDEKSSGAAPRAAAEPTKTKKKGRDVTERKEKNAMKTRGAAKPPSRAVAALQSILARAAGATTAAVTTPEPNVASVPAVPMPGDICASHVQWRARRPSDTLDDDGHDTPLCAVPFAAPSRTVRTESTLQTHPLMAIVSSSSVDEDAGPNDSTTFYVVCGSLEHMVDGLACAPHRARPNGGGTSQWPVFKITEPVHLAWLRQRHREEMSESTEAGYTALWAHVHERMVQHARAEAIDASSAVGTLTLSWRLRTTEGADGAANGPELADDSAGRVNSTTQPHLPEVQNATESAGLNTISTDHDANAQEQQRAAIHRLFHPTVMGLEEEIAVLSDSDVADANPVRDEGTDRRDLPAPRRGPFLTLQHDLRDISLARREEEEEALESWLDRFTALHDAHRAAAARQGQDWDWVVRAVNIDSVPLVRFEEAAVHERLDPCVAISPRSWRLSSTPPLCSPRTTTTHLGELVVSVTHRGHQAKRFSAGNADGSGSARSRRSQASSPATTPRRSPARAAAQPAMLCELSLFDPPRTSQASQLTLTPARVQQPPLRSPEELSMTAATLRGIPNPPSTTAAETSDDANAAWLIGVARAPASRVGVSRSADESQYACAADSAEPPLFQARFSNLSWSLSAVQLATRDVRRSATLSFWQLVGESSDKEATPTTGCLGTVTLTSLLSELAAYTHTTAGAEARSTSEMCAVSAWLPLETSVSAHSQGRVRVQLERVPHAPTGSSPPPTAKTTPPISSAAPLHTGASLVTLCGQLVGLHVTALEEPTARQLGTASVPRVKTPDSSTPMPPVALLVTYPAASAHTPSVGELPRASGLVFSTHLLSLADGDPTTSTRAKPMRTTPRTARPHVLRQARPTITAPPSATVVGRAAPVVVSSALPIPVPVPVPTPIASAATAADVEKASKAALSHSAHDIRSSSASSSVSRTSPAAGDEERIAEASIAGVPTNRKVSTVAGRSDTEVRSECAPSLLPAVRAVDLPPSDRGSAGDVSHPESLFESFDDDDDADADAEEEDAPLAPPQSGADSMGASLVPVHSHFFWQQKVLLTPQGSSSVGAAARRAPSSLCFHLARTTTTSTSRLGTVTESQVAELLASATIPDADWSWLLATVSAQLSRCEVEPVTLHTSVAFVLPPPLAVRVTLQLFVFAAPAASLTRAVEWIAKSEAPTAAETGQVGGTRTMVASAAATCEASAVSRPRLVVCEAVLAVDTAPVGVGSALCAVYRTRRPPSPLAPAQTTGASTSSPHRAPAKVLSLLFGGLFARSHREGMRRGSATRSLSRGTWQKHTHLAKLNALTDATSVRQLAWSRVWAALAADWDVEVDFDVDGGVAVDDGSCRTPYGPHRQELGTARTGAPLRAVDQRGVLRTVPTTTRSPQPDACPSAWCFTPMPMTSTERPHGTHARQSADAFAKLVGCRTGHIVLAYERLVDEAVSMRDEDHVTAADSAPRQRSEWIVLIDGGLTHCPVQARRATADEGSVCQRLSSSVTLAASRRGPPPPQPPHAPHTKPAGATTTSSAASANRAPRSSQLSVHAPPTMSADALQVTSQGSADAVPRARTNHLHACASVLWNTTLRHFTTVDDCLVDDASALMIATAHPQTSAAGSAAPRLPARYVHHTGVLVGNTLWLLGGWRVVSSHADDSGAMSAVATAVAPASTTLRSRLLTVDARLTSPPEVPERHETDRTTAAGETGASGLVARRRSEVQRAARLAAPATVIDNGARIMKEDGDEDGNASAPLFLFDDRDDAERARMDDSGSTAANACCFALHRDIRTLDLSADACGSVPVVLSNRSHKPILYSPAAPPKTTPSLTASQPARATPPWLSHFSPLEETPQLTCHVAMVSGDWIVLFGGLTPTEAVWEDEEPPLAAADTVFAFHTRRLLWYRHRRDTRRHVSRNADSEAGTHNPPRAGVPAHRTNNNASGVSRGDDEERRLLRARVEQWPLARYGHAVARVPTSPLRSFAAPGDRVGRGADDDEDDGATYVVYGGATTTISTGHQWLVPTEELLWLCHIRAVDAQVRWQCVQVPTSSPLTPRFLPSLQVMPVPTFLSVYAESKAKAMHGGVSSPPTALAETQTNETTLVTSASSGTRVDRRAIVSAADLCRPTVTPLGRAHFVLVVSGGSSERTALYSTATTAAAVTPSLSLDNSTPSLSTRSMSNQRTPATTPMKAPPIAVADRSPCGMYSAFVENWLGGASLGTIFAHIHLDASS